MAWIESHQDLAHHPKVARLAGTLEVSVPAAIGHLHCLWWWCLSYADDGDLTDFSDFEIAYAAQWQGEPDVFVEALQKAGWLDGREVHDWHEYGGKLAEKRMADAQRKRNMRSFYAEGTADAVKQRDGSRCRYCGKTVNWSDRRSEDGATYDHIDPYGPETEQNVVVACRGCNSRKGQRTPEEAGLTLKPVSGRTKSALDAGQVSISREQDTTEQNTTEDNTTEETAPLPAQAIPDDSSTLNDLKAILVELFGEPPPKNWSLYNRIATWIRDQGGDVGQVRLKAGLIFEEWGRKACTATALEKHWTRYDAEVGQLSDEDVKRYQAEVRRQRRRKEIHGT